ncbi:MAG: sensor histidine kinase, partial [Chitinophagales bacterium]
MNALSNHIEKVYKLFTPVFKEQQTLNYTIILMQKVYMIGAIFSLALSCVGFAFGDFQGTIPAIIAGMIMVFFRVLSSMGFHQLSWILLLIMPTSVLALAPLITPVAPTSIFAFFIFQTFAFILFKRIRILYGFFIFYTLSGALFLYLNFSTYGDKLYDEPSIAYINLVGGLILQFFVLWLMQYIRAKREDTIRFNEAKFQGIFEYNPLGIIVTPQNKSISKMVNERMSDLLGYSKEELSSKGVEVLTHPEDKEAHKQMYQDLLDSRRSFFEIEKRYVHKNGQIIWCKTAVALIRDKAKQPTYVIAMLQDITQRKQQEQKIQQLLEELQTLNAQLEGKVEERTQELSDANKELIRSNQDLEQFAYAASHDLKEPLRMIKSFVQVIDRKYNQHFDETGKTYIGFVTDGVDRMAKLIHCLLQYSKVGQQNFQFQQVNITNIIEHKLLDLQQLVQEKNATIHITNLPKNIVCEK